MKTLQLILLMIISINMSGHELKADFKTNIVNKKIKDFPNTYDLSTPLNAGITYSYININGKFGSLKKISTSLYKYFLPDENMPDVEVDEAQKNRFFDTTIKETITYKNSVACVISQNPDSSYALRFFQKENGNWVNSGENFGENMLSCRNQFEQNAEKLHQQLTRLSAIATLPPDTLSFVNYLHSSGKNPEHFLTDKLKEYELLMYGEVHGRKASWTFLMQAINSKQFPKNAGTIFMEMASNKQKEIDLFFEKDTIDKALLLDVFKDYIITGWDDKGMFDFLIEVWKVNKQLPANKQVRVIATDTPRIYTKEGLKNEIQDRDGFMAKTIMNYLQEKEDKRNALFVAGSAHICKSLNSAGKILTEKMPNTSYTLFTHTPRLFEQGKVPERIRGGMFDYAFYKNGDVPVAFELKNSPFGKEPFDGYYMEGTGKFEENFDGYIFLGALDTEPNGEVLLEMYDDTFIQEIDRRYKLTGGDFASQWRLSELSTKAVIDKIRSEHTEMQWEDYVAPLVNGKVVQ